MCLYCTDASHYYDSASEASGPPLEAVVTIPIGKSPGIKGREKPSGYVVYRMAQKVSHCQYLSINHTFNEA